MASCCRTRCSCVITAGDRITVSGNGSEATPYVISADLTVVTVLDTPSIDETITGAGTAGSPYVLSAAVKLNAAPPGGGTNLIQTSATGLYLECAQVRTCISAGVGLTYNAATGVMIARPSVSPGNVTTIGPDGGIFTPSSGQLTVTDTPSTDLTLTGAGTAASPYVLTSAVILDPTPPGGGTNLIKTNADGLYLECAQVRTCISAGNGAAYDPVTGIVTARLSPVAGNTTVFAPDGGLLTQSSGQLTVVDTPSIDETLTGTGTAANPYVLTSAVKLNPAPPGGGANLIQPSATGLFLECAQVRTCISAGNGLTYNAATGVMIARPSTSPGNTTVIGPDGGIFTPAAGVLTVTDTPSTDLTLTGAGTTASPYVLTSAVILDPTPPGGGTNLIKTNADGLYLECAQVRTCISAGNGAAYNPATGVVTARLSTDAGNTAVFGTDGGLYASGGGGGGSTFLQAADTPSIDTTVMGAGTVGSPYVVSAAVILDPTPPGGGTNLINSNADGLYLECAQVRTCISAGTGASYNAATGVVTARLSTDAGNSTVLGTDGGLYSPPGGGTATVLQAADTPSIDTTITGAGTVGSPYVLSAAVILDPTPPGGGTNLINSNADGLYLECAQVRTCISAGVGLMYNAATGVMIARPSTSPGNTTTIGPDGGIFTPAAGVLTVTDTQSIDQTLTGAGTTASPYALSSSVIIDPTPPGGAANLLKTNADGLYVELVTGCGLDGAGTTADPLIVVPEAASLAWPWPCDVVTKSTLHCDPTTKKLWTPPDHYSAMDQIYVEHFVGGVLDPIGPTGGWVVIDPGANQQFNIPAGFIGNACRPWGHMTTNSGTWDIEYTDDAVFELGYVVVLDANPAEVRALWGQLAPLGAAAHVRGNGTAHESLWNIPAASGSLVTYFPAINVTSGSVVIHSWISDALVITTTNTP